MKKNLLSFFFLCCLLGSVVALRAQDNTLYQKQWFVQGGDTMPYRILLPENYTPSKRYPLVLFLHGRGESGRDNEKQLTHGAALFLRDSIRRKYPAIVVFPQCAATNYWSNVHTVIAGEQTGKRDFYFVEEGEPTGAMKLLLSLLGNLLLRYPVEKKQVYAMGLSMGGMGTYEVVRRRPGLFAAAVAVCGGAHPGTAKKLTATRWWIFHGLKDDVVNPDFSRQIAAAIQKNGGAAKLTLYPEANHNSWDSAFGEKDLLRWLFSQHR